MNKLSVKIIFLSISVCLFTAAVFGYFNFVMHEENVAKLQLKDNEIKMSILTESINSKIEELKKDVQFLSSTPPIRGIIRASKNGGVDPQGNSTDKVWKLRLSKIFKEMLFVKDKYIQIRFISLKEEGKELVRVERNGLKVETVKEYDLQSKKNESYFKGILETQRNNIYLSKFSYNREMGKVTLPKKMVFRAAIPVFENIGNPFGFVIVNVDYTEILGKIKSFNSLSQNYMILDGDYKVLLDSKIKQIRKKGIEHLEARIDDPSLALDSMSTDSIISENRNGHSYIIKKINYNSINKDDFLIIAMVFDQKVLLSEESSSEALFNILIILFILLVSGTSSFFLSRKLTKPINHLAQLANDLKEGNLKNVESIEVSSKDEIGQLSNTLLGLSRDLILTNNDLQLQKTALDETAIIAETDIKGRITYVNGRFVSLSQYSKEELIGNDHRIVNSGQHSKEFFKEMWGTILQGEIWKGEICNKAKDGSFYWVDTTISSVKDDKGNISRIIAIRFDITNRKNIESQLIEANNRAKKAMEVKSTFLANMSHEIRTPLNSILGLTDILESQINDPELVKYLLTMKGAGDSLLQIINDILDLSKIDAGQLNIEKIPFDLISCIEETYELLAYKAKDKGLSLLLNVDWEIPSLVMGDSLRTKQILINLINNAIKFTSEGSVYISLELIKNKSSDKVAYTKITVTDTGVGISDKNLDKIFDSFTQADDSITRDFGGTGLGLNISKQLVEKMGGTLGVTSQLNEGSEFSFVIPFEISKNKLVQLNQNGYLVKDSNVLIVDDNENNRLVFSKILKHMEANVFEAESGKGALEVLEKNEIELILLDCQMPETNGFELIKQIKERSLRDSVNIIMLTSDHKDGDQKSAKKLGADEYLIKPIRKTELEIVIRKLKSKSSNGKILVADDDLLFIEVMQDLFHSNNYEFQSSTSLKELEDRVFNKNERYDLIILDYDIADENAYDFMNKHKLKTPVILASGSVDIDFEKSWQEVGFASFFKKPFDNEKLLLTAKNIIKANKDKLTLVENLQGQQGHETKILCVDDSVDNRNLLKIYFKNQNFKVDFAENGLEALNKVKNQKYDFVFMDMQMPVMDGYQATTKIRTWEKENSIPAMMIVALTANALVEEKEKTVKAGCNAYLTKPIRKTTLLSFISENIKSAA